MEKIKITVVGSGYVGMSLSVLLAKQNCVTVLDIDSERISKINNKKSTIEDSLIEELLDTASLNLTATDNPDLAYADANFIIIAKFLIYKNKILFKRKKYFLKIKIGYFKGVIMIFTLIF